MLAGETITAEARAAPLRCSEVDDDIDPYVKTDDPTTMKEDVRRTGSTCRGN